MKICRSYLFIIFLLALFLSACAGNDAANANSANSNSSLNASTNAVQHDNVEELANIIKLNILPDEATYIETNQANQNNAAGNEKKLVAVLKFSPENAAKVAAEAEKYKPAVPAEIGAENWFPAELVAQTQLTGNESLKGSTYAANDFFQSPYSNGKLTRITDTDYFILELTTF